MKFLKRFIKHYIEMNEFFLSLALSSMSLVDFDVGHLHAKRLVLFLTHFGSRS